MDRNSHNCETCQALSFSVKESDLLRRSVEKSNPICIRQALRITTPDERFWQCAGKGQQIVIC